MFLSKYLLSNIKDLPKETHYQLILASQETVTTLYCPDPGESGVAYNCIDVCKTYIFQNKEELLEAIRQNVSSVTQYRVIKCEPMRVSLDINIE